MLVRLTAPVMLTVAPSTHAPVSAFVTMPIRWPVAGADFQGIPGMSSQVGVTCDSSKGLKPSAIHA